MGMYFYKNCNLKNLTYLSRNWSISHHYQVQYYCAFFKNEIRFLRGKSVLN